MLKTLWGSLAYLRQNAEEVTEHDAIVQSQRQCPVQHKHRRRNFAQYGDSRETPNLSGDLRKRIATPLLFSLALSRKGCPNCLLENIRPIRKIRGRFAYQPLPNRALAAKYLLPMSGKLASLGVAVPRIMAPRL
jgi:hypothetical protein